MTMHRTAGWVALTAGLGLAGCAGSGQPTQSERHLAVKAGGDVDSGLACQCTGTGPDGSVTVGCGESACGSDGIMYACSETGWTPSGAS
jgi:hypothetical protein